jgi:hypothetical protein
MKWRIFGPKEDKVTGVRMELHDNDLHLYLPVNCRERDGRYMERSGNTCKILTGELKGRDQLRQRKENRTILSKWFLRNRT